MAVAAVRARHVVLLFEARADTHLRGLLANGQVHGPGDEALTDKVVVITRGIALVQVASIVVEILDSRLEEAYPIHEPQHMAQLVFV